MVHPMWSLEEATENSPGRKAGVWSVYILRPEGPIVARPGRKAGIKNGRTNERRRCGTKSNVGEIGFPRVNSLNMKNKDLFQILAISESEFNYRFHGAAGTRNQTKVQNPY